MLPDETKEIKFKVCVRENSYFTQDQTTAVNISYGRADGFGTVSDTAQTVVYRQSGGVDPITQLTIQKYGHNVSKGEIENKLSISANPNDTLEFYMTVTSTSNTILNNVIIRDVLPSGLSYISRTTSVDNRSVSDGIISGGINMGSMNPNQVVVIRFNASVLAPGYFADGTTTMTNIAYVRADNVSERGSQIPVYIFKGSPIRKITQIQTGANSVNFLTIASTAIVLIFGYAMYSKTGYHKFREANMIAKRHRSDFNKFDFSL
jgi:uncharacterized repeat protein (TIGR01451 family)